MIIDHNKEKIFNSIIYFVRNTKYCGKVKLMKLLYYLDFFHFRETGKSVTGLKYQAWQFGPYPEQLANKLNDVNDAEVKDFLVIQRNDQFTEFKPRKKFDNQFFTKRELRILEHVAFIFQEARADDIIESSHLKNHPWDLTIKEKGMKGEINYWLALDDSSPKKEDLLEDIEDRENIEGIFHGEGDSILPR
jgi:uncharacterized phage-associated protein